MKVQGFLPVDIHTYRNIFPVHIGQQTERLFTLYFNITINQSAFAFSIPGGPYGAFGGRDASRGLATFNVTSKDDFEYDDLSDLSAMEMDSVREWELQFKGN